MIFSQPSTFRFRWPDCPSVVQVVVLPALVKAADERARPIEPPQELIPAVVANVIGS